MSARAHSAGVTPLKAFHDAQAVRLPLPEKHDVVSPPVSACKTGRALHLSTPSTCAIAVACDFPVPIAITRLSQPSLRANLIGSTTTSVSTVLMQSSRFPAWQHPQHATASWCSPRRVYTVIATLRLLPLSAAPRLHV